MTLQLVRFYRWHGMKKCFATAVAKPDPGSDPDLSTPDASSPDSPAYPSLKTLTLLRLHFCTLHSSLACSSPIHHTPAVPRLHLEPPQTTPPHHKPPMSYTPTMPTHTLRHHASSTWQYLHFNAPLFTPQPCQLTPHLHLNSTANAPLRTFGDACLG